MTKQEKYSSEGQKKHHKNVILNDSEESRILNGRIKNENRKHFYYYHPTLMVGILPRPKSSFRMTSQLPIKAGWSLYKLSVTNFNIN